MTSIRLPAVLCLLSLLSSPLDATIIGEGTGSWEGDLATGQTGLKEAAAQAAAEVQAARFVPPAVPGRGEGEICLDYGTHTELIPDFNPMSELSHCLQDPYPDAASFQVASTTLVAQLRAQSGEPVAHEGEFQQGIGRGHGKPDSLNEETHWGEAAILYLTGKRESLTPVGVTSYTYRAYRDFNPGNRKTYIKAVRKDFHGGADGQLLLVTSRNGEYSPEAKKMMWGPLWVDADLNSMSPIYVIQWHQLLKSWLLEKR